MRKKWRLYLWVLICISFFLTTSTYANMAAPKEADIGSAITFEKNEDIAVLSEVLDIVVQGSKAEITATYRMKNVTSKPVTTPSMFLSPNISQNGTEVQVRGTPINFKSQSYHLEYDTEVKTNEWQYSVLSDPEISAHDKSTVDTVTFEIEFAPHEVCDVEVSYTYNLGGYPNYNFNAKCGKINYYLTPATMWKDFSKLTINLYLDEDMPVMTHSNLKFRKVGKRAYQYVSDTLPTENLEIEIDENAWQNILSTLRSPYLMFSLMIYAPFIIMLLMMIVFLVWISRKRKK